MKDKAPPPEITPPSPEEVDIEPPIMDKSILHVTTEFASARAGGLGVVATEMAISQAKKGNDVSVLVPFFKRDDLSSFDFLSTTPVYEDDLVRVGYKGRTIEAQILTFTYQADDTSTIKVKALSPLGEYSYLTTFDGSNPYVLSSNAILSAIDNWAKYDSSFREHKDTVITKLENLEDIKAKLKKCSQIASGLLREENKFSQRRINQVASSLPSDEAKQQLLATARRNHAQRIEMISRLKNQNMALELKKKELLQELIMPGYSLDGVLFKLMNEKSHIISMLNSQFIKNKVEEMELVGEELNFIHLHHFGEEAKELKRFFDENPELHRSAVIKSLHGLNIKLTHLDGRDHPINVGIANADAIHLVSYGSRSEILESKTGESAIKIYESDAIDTNKIKVAQNGINIDKFSIERLWADVCRQHSSALGEMTDIDFSSLNTVGKKDLFKSALSRVINSPYIYSQLVNNSWSDSFNTESPIILYVGRLSSEKGYSRLEQAALTAREHGANLAIMGYGDPVFEAEMISKYPEVIFLNSREDQRLLGNLIRGAADLALLTSNRETAGLVLLEAQASGASVITSNIPGPVSISNPDTIRVFQLESNGVDESNQPIIDEDATAFNLNQCILDAIVEHRGKNTTEQCATYENNISFTRDYSIEAVSHEVDGLYRFALSQVKRLEVSSHILSMESQGQGFIFTKTPKAFGSVEKQSKSELIGYIYLLLEELLDIANTYTAYSGKSPEAVVMQSLFNYHQYNDPDRIPGTLRSRVIEIGNKIIELPEKDRSLLISSMARQLIERSEAVKIKPMAILQDMPPTPKVRG